MKKTRTMLLLTLFLLLALPVMRTEKASAAAGWMSENKPYQYTEATEYLPQNNESFLVGGASYNEGFVFYNWYQTKLSQVLFNLKGEYSSFSFEVGHVDGTTNADVKLYIYIDGLLSDTVDVSYEELSHPVTVKLNGAQHLKIVCESQGHHYDIYYGVFNGTWVKNGTKEPPLETSTWLEDCPPYDSTNVKMITEQREGVLMGGDLYENALQFYLWNPAESRMASARFNLGEKYETFSFTTGHMDGTTRARADLTVKLDGEIAEVIKMDPDGLPVRKTISVAGKKQMIMELTSPEPLNTYNIYYGVGEASFKTNGKVTGIKLTPESARVTNKNDIVILKATVLPADAVNKGVIYSSSDPSVAAVDTLGRVMPVSNGTAVIKAVTEEGGFKAECEIVVDVPELEKPQETEPQETEPQETEPQETEPQETEPDGNSGSGGSGDENQSEETPKPSVDTKKTYSYGNLKYKILSAGSRTVQVVGMVNAKKTSVTIPGTAKIGGKAYKVTRINEKAFTKNTKIKTVVIGANVQIIDKNAFKNCTKLSQINVKSKKLTKVGANALKKTKAKIKILIPNKYYAKYKKLFAGKGQSRITFVRW